MRGGAALILGGAHEDLRCIGAGAIGADGMSSAIERGPMWKGPALFLYNLDDLVVDADATAEVLNELESGHVIECQRDRAGNHAFDSYLANGSLIELVRYAVGAARTEGAST
ncbi:MAG: hypothetical protein NT062_25135 [Proteobacteria bacterium]|nr:hypothetical protein [Pseudomonadota bacterium]